MIVDIETGAARMPSAELAMLRKAAASQGIAINQVSTVSECLDASIKALPTNVIDDILRFVDTGESQLTSCATVSDFNERLAQLSKS